MKTGDRVRGKTTEASEYEWFSNHDDQGMPLDMMGRGPDTSWHEGTLIIRTSSLFGGFTLYELLEDGSTLDYDTIQVLEPRPPEPPGHKEDTAAQRIQRLLGYTGEETEGETEEEEA